MGNTHIFKHVNGSVIHIKHIGAFTRFFSAKLFPYFASKYKLESANPFISDPNYTFNQILFCSKSNQYLGSWQNGSMGIQPAYPHWPAFMQT